MDSHKHTLADTESSGVHPTVESEQQIPHIENVFKDYKYTKIQVSQIASCVFNDNVTTLLPCDDVGSLRYLHGMLNPDRKTISTWQTA